MVWALLVATGVAVVSMTLFGARFTRRPATKDTIVEDLDLETDPDDPWAAWKPRPMEAFERRRPRVWPVLASMTGLLMVGAGFAGARQTLWETTYSETGTTAISTPQPYTVEVEIPPTPSPKPTPTPTPRPATPAPTAPPPPPSTPSPEATAAAAATPAPTAAAQGSGPSISATPSCSAGTLSVNYSATADGADLAWIALYVDGEVAKGGPISGSSHSSSYQQPATSGDHAIEVSVEDKAGRTSRRQYQVHCP